ncbi:hypothetical protein [Streptosporangium sp. NPDC050280]|uniref:hypothetical protein n=1 Tax=unclassified Streptosporangium TaxID=2632669 RepID=UPI00343DE9E5
MTALATFAFTLVLDCGHRADHSVWEGVDPRRDLGWVPGMGRWCGPCDRNSTVTDVLHL